MTTTSINIAEAKEDFSELVNRVAHNRDRVIITRRGKEIAVLIPIEDLQLLQTQQDKRDLAEAVEALKETREHGTITLSELKEEIG